MENLVILLTILIKAQNDNTQRKDFGRQIYITIIQNNLKYGCRNRDLTILVKKRAFSSLAENYRTDLLNSDERLFIRATKFLFQNKCKQISAYEQLTKINTVVTEIGSVDYHLLPVLFSATDTLSSVFNLFGSSSFNKFKSVVDRIKTIVNLSREQINTTWTTNVLSSFKTDLGEGTGVIEFTTASYVSTTTSIHFNNGKFDITFSDPYELMRITHNDIEKAIADATNVSFGSNFLQLSLDTLNKGIEQNKADLNKLRARRGANPINFIVDPNTFLGKRIRTIIDNSGIEIIFTGSILQVKIDPGYLRGGDVAQQDGLDTGSHFGATSSKFLNNVQNTVGALENAITDITNSTSAQPGSEANLFGSIIRSLYNQLQLNQNTQTTQRAHNANTTDLRKKLRLHYGSKLIIQPMDVVHIFIGSKTKVDNKILGGLQDNLNATGFLSTANKALMNLQDFFSAGQDNSIEKSIFVGNDFPNWLWLIMRNQFTTDTAGTQVFAGLVKTNTSTYNNGVFTVQVSGGDNATYFNFGIVNFKPANEVWNGSLYDPLTPFDIKFDSATGFQSTDIPKLLPENLSLFQSVFSKVQSGVYVGKRPSTNNYVQDTERVQNSDIRHVFYDPDGMIYKWKEGIGALTLSGNNYQETTPTNVGIPPQTVDPFAGQDVMNVISLLITGEPYNFATFYKAAQQFDGFGRDPQTGQDPSVSYFKNLQTDLKKRNLLYGDFVPFKKLVMDTDTYKNILNNQIRAQGFDTELNDLLAQRADLNDRIAMTGNFTQDLSSVAKDIQAKVDVLNAQIGAKLIQINDELNKINKPISLIGNDITLDYDPFLDPKGKNNLSDIYNQNKDLRRRIHYLTRRLSWKVRANEDINLFIVDDTYDKDYDIQAFEKQFTDANTFKSEYVTVDKQITQAAELLDLEVFADTQGNIQVRQPQYNKMPSSVFYRMLQLKNEFDIQIYPQFIEDLYVSQIDNILNRVEILEDEIRMYGLALSLSKDSDIQSYLASSQSQNIRGNGTSTPFRFITNESDGSISRVALKNFSNPNDTNVYAGGLTAITDITTQATINNIASVSSRVGLLQQSSATLTNTNGLNSIISNNATKQRKDQINARLQIKANYTFDLTQLFTNSAQLVGSNKLSQVDLLRILQSIADRIAERQRILKVATAAIKNAQESLSLIQNKDRIANKLIIPGLVDNKKIPKPFENLIEDESNDDYGPGSGHRYIIKNQYIKDITITEKAPDFSAVEVEGLATDGFKTELPADLNGFQGPGNALTTALAIDYDMWRMYGIRIPQSVKKPFLTDPETQCAPFAVALLNKARKEIQSGSIKIFGNEYMQPGEIVYLENQDMLYYVESVSHDFKYGSGFTTTLNVAYGHMPGEYIPTYLDTAGKLIYKNRSIVNLVNKKQESVNQETHVGTIMGSLSAAPFAEPQDSIMTGTFGNEI